MLKILENKYVQGMIITIIMLVAFYFIAPAIGYRPYESEKFLENMGYTEIEMGEYEYLSCGHDLFSSQFSGIHPISKKRVKGAVCFGPFSEKIVRLK